MGNICLRGIDDEVKKHLKSQAVQAGISVNALILKYISKAVGINSGDRKIYHDLDSLAGTWTDENPQEFFDSTSHFDKIDEEMWK